MAKQHKKIFKTDLEKIIADRTRDLEEKNHQLEKINHQKNEYLGIVAHNLRSPLTAILSYTELTMTHVRSGRFGPQQIVKDLAKVEAVTKHMAFFINELLDIAAIESGKINLNRRAECVASLIGEIVPMHSPRAEEKNIRLAVETPDSLPKIQVDRMKIISVLDNLLSNAIKYTHPGGSVRVFGESKGPDVRIHVEDTGQGLSEDDLKMVFTPFRKLSARPTDHEPSTGLGLAIVKKIVEIHGGRVWASGEKGKGARFSFSIPVQRN